MSRLLSAALGLSVLATPAFCGDMTVTVIGSVLSSSYSTGPFAGAAANDTATMTFKVGTTSTPVAPGQLENYPIDAASFTMDINGPTGAVLTGSPVLGIQNNFPAADGVRNFTGSFATGQSIAFEFGAVGTFFSTVDITQLAGTYDVAANLTSFNYMIFGAGGFMEIFPETLIIELPPPVCVEITGTVLTNTYSSGIFAGISANDIAVMTFNVGTIGTAVAPGQLVNYPVEISTFSLDINGPTGAALTMPTNFGIQNNFPAADGVRNFGGPLATGQTIGFEFGAVGTFFNSVELCDLLGTYNIAANLTSFGYVIQGGGGFMEIFPETMVIKDVPTFSITPYCFGDGGDGMGCTDCPCGNNAPLGSAGGCLNSNMTSAVLAGSGIADVNNDTLHFDLTGANVSTFAVLTSADNQLPQLGACPVGSGIQSAVLDGLRCVGGNARRHGARATDAMGNTTNGWGPPAGPAGGLIAQYGFVAGQTRNFQCFYRELPNQVCSRGQNTSNAVSVTFQ